MRIAIPLAHGKCGGQDEYCDHLAIIDVEIWTRAIVGRRDVSLPLQSPSSLPESLASLGVAILICGDMEPRLQRSFREHGVVVIAGAPPQAPEQLIQNYLVSSLSR